MTIPARLLPPPSLAAWLLSLFVGVETESLEGDLLEEFSQLGAQKGVPAARRWYWRQTLGSIVHLFGSRFLAAPWSTAAIVVGGFFLNQMLFPFSERAIFAVIEKSRIFDRHFGLYLFLASDGIAGVHVMVAAVVSSLMALVARGKEMVATGMLVLVLIGMTGAAALVWIANGNWPVMWPMLLWSSADWFAMLLSAAMIRSGRSAWRNVKSAPDLI